MNTTQKPRNWRRYFSYRPSRSLNWTHYRLRDTAEMEYRRWLATERGMTLSEADLYISKMDRRTLIRAEHAPELPQYVEQPIKAGRDNVALLCAKIRKLDWAALERVQNAIDQRLAA